MIPFLALGLAGVGAAAIYLTATSKKTAGGGGLSKLPPGKARSVVSTAVSTPIANALKDAWRRTALTVPLAQTFTPRPVPAAPPPPPPVEEPPRLVHITTPTIDLVPGQRYLGVLNVSGAPAAILAAPFVKEVAAVRAAAHGEGFTDVYASKDGPPTGWISWKQGLGRGDWYVVGVYAGPPRAAPRSKTGVQIVDAWTWTK